MNEYEELIYSLIYNCKQEISKEEMKILNQAGAIYNTYNQLTEQMGCPLEMVLNLIKESNTLDEHCQTQDIWFDYKGKLISGSFATLKYYNNEFIIEVETYDMFDSNYDCDSYELKVKDYKKNWWLKSNKSD